MSRDEAQAAVGEALQAGKPRTSPTKVFGASGSCVYRPPAVDGSVVQVIVLGTKIPRSVYNQQLGGQAGGGHSTQISGLGEDAFSIPGVVSVFDHGLAITVEIVAKGRPGTTGAITALARKALARAASLE